jgi:hypothetical protein
LLLRGLAIFSGSDLNSLQRFIRTKSEAEIKSCIQERSLQVNPIPLGRKRNAKIPARQEIRLLKQNASFENLRSSYLPCSHEGPCDSSVCMCPNSSHLCTKFCRCEPNCRFRYTGCRCKGKCGCKSCTCKSYEMECDPDLCDCCKTDDSQCQNQKLRNHMYENISHIFP